jgi:mannose-6-phosphate isomerase
MKKYTEKRPWGKFEQFTHNEKSTVKILKVKPKERLSLQYHKKRKEFWRVIEGSGKVTIGNKVHKAKIGDEFTILVKQKHRIEASAKGIKLLEIALGNFDEKDNIRLEDDYNRKSPAKK